MHQVAVRVRIVVLLCLIGLGLQAPSALAVVDVALAPPVAVDDVLTTKVNRAEFVFVLDNDTDADFDELTVTTPTPTAGHGTVDCDEFGTCEYTPATDYVGPDGFDYVVSDGSATDTGHVAVTVVANTPPVAEDDDLSATADRPNRLGVLDNDTDADDDQLLVTSATEPAHGSVTCDFECEYTPDAGYTGADSFDYTVSDGAASDIGHVSVQVNPNGPPEAVDDTAVRQDSVAVQVLENDSDPDGDELTVVSVTQPAHGTATVEGGGSFVNYTATGAYSASDSFTYTVSDGFGETDVATVTLTPCPSLASALDGGSLVTGERWMVCSSLQANGSVGALTTVLPPSGGSSALLTSGDVANAPGPNDLTGAGTDNDTQFRGAIDVSVLRLELQVPAGANCLSFEVAFQSEEYPEFVNQSFNDGFLAELDTSDWVVNGSTIDAPHNFALDGAGGIISVNGSFFEPGRVITDTGAQYDGSTPRLTVQTPVTPGPHVLYLSIFDAGDGILDSGAFVDRLQAGAAGPAGCSAGANEPPVAADDSLTTAEDTASAPLNVLANDSDPDGHPLTVTTLAPTAAHGTVSCTAAGMCTYTPSANFHGSDSFTYAISDGHGGSDTATVSVTVTPVNDQPNAVDDSLTTPQDTAGQVSVLANDTDADGDALTVTTPTPAALHGTVSCTAAGVCTYTPSAGYSGPDSFQYSISDGHTGTDTATVSITVTAGNHPPVADDDAIVTPEDTAGGTDVLVGDTDADGDTLTVTTPTPAAAHGTVSCTAAGMCTYTPSANFHGSDSFTYAVSDGHGGTDTATVAVTVTSANDDPGAVDDSLTTAEDTAKDVNVLANDTDPDGDTLSVTTASPTALHGTVSCTPAGVCTYTPNAGYSGADSFVYGIADGFGGTDTATVAVTVTPASGNAPPVANDDVTTTPEDVADSFNVLSNDTDPDGDDLEVTSLAPTAQHGTVACGAGGTCEYTPNANYHGPDGFDYTISDGKGGTDTGHVTVTVNSANDQPNAVDDSLTTGEDTASAPVNVLANDSDPDGDTLTVTTPTPTASHGTVSCTAAGMCTYTPSPNYNGPDSFTYAVSDGHGGTDTATVDVTVTSANDDPNAVDDSMSTGVDTPRALAVLANDTDPDDDPLSIASNTAPSHGTVDCTVASATVCTYSPALGFVGSDSFTYTVSDGHGGSDTATVTIAVTAANALPKCGGVHPSKTKLWPPRHKMIVITLSGATDADGDTLTYAITKVTQDEKVRKAISKNDKGPDAQRVTGHPNQVKLRAERIGDGNGRVYRIFFTVTDGNGGTCSDMVKVKVPRKKHGNAVDDVGKSYNSFD
jgi:hypothetical protein